jgi:hypothetical protein
MSNAIKVDTTVDQALAQAVPALRPLLGRRVELIAIEADAAEGETARKLTVNELLSRRIDAPPGASVLTDDDIRRAIVEGALSGNL